MKGIINTRTLTLLLGFLSAARLQAGLIYWNGEPPNSPPYNTNSAWQPSGTWNNDLNNLDWSTNNLEDRSPDPAPENYSAANEYGSSAVVFANGLIAGPYSIRIDDSFGQVNAVDMHCDTGPLTLTGGTLDFDSADANALNLISSAARQMFIIDCVLSNSFINDTDGSAFHKYQTGALVLGATNAFAGQVVIEGGTLALACDQSIPETNGLVLANGDDRPSDGFINTPATFNTGGHNQTLGPLDLQGPDITIPRTIDFSNGRGALSFADSSGMAWSTTSLDNNTNNPGLIPLLITNYVPGTSRLRFGTNSAGLTPAQLGQVVFRNQLSSPAIIDTNGYVTPSFLIPNFQSIAVSRTVVEITVGNTVAGTAYEVDYRNTLALPSAWLLFGQYTAAAGTLTVTDTFAAHARFYRVEALIP